MIDYQSMLSERASSVRPSAIRKFFDIAAEMEDVISLSIGEPDFKTPWHIREAGIESLQKGKTKYSPNRGFTDLLNEISRYYDRRFGCHYNPKDQVLVTVGGSEAIDLCVRALVGEGDEVIIPEPSFVCYEPITRLAGGVPVHIATRVEDEFRLTPELLSAAITKKTKLLILPYPNNPTGAVMRREDLEAISKIIIENNIMVLSDEIYCELTYGGKSHVSIASIDGMYERTVLVNGFSKSYAMTGWRLGYALGPEPVISVMTKLHQYAIMCAPSTAQYAAVVALRDGDEDVEKMRSEYDMRRRYIVDGFREIGFDCFKPEGAFYIFPSVKSTGLRSGEFCERLLLSQHVAVVPGDAFGESGDGFIRVSYSYSVAHIKEALERIRQFVKEL